MRPEDAFWAARIVARFSEATIRAIVARRVTPIPRATDYLTRTLMARREKVLRAWLTGVNPLADAALDRSGRLSASNVAVGAGVATPPTSYTLQWFTLDGVSSSITPVGEPTRADGASAPPASLGRVDAAAPASAIASEAVRFIGVSITGDHANHPAWKTNPATFYFRRTPEGWDIVGVERINTSKPGETR